MPIEKVTLIIDVKDFRTILSLAEENLRFSSGRGTHECKRKIERLNELLNNTIERIDKKPKFLLQRIQPINGYICHGISQEHGVFTIHWQKEKVSR